MGYATILGLDLGKFKSVCCAMNMATGDHAFETIQTTPAALHELLTHHAGDDPSAVLLVIETCDAAGWVHDLAAALGLCVKVANCCHAEPCFVKLNEARRDCIAR